MRILHFYRENIELKIAKSCLLTANVLNSGQSRGSWGKKKKYNAFFFFQRGNKLGKEDRDDTSRYVSITVNRHGFFYKKKIFKREKSINLSDPSPLRLGVRYSLYRRGLRLCRGCN